MNQAKAEDVSNLLTRGRDCLPHLPYAPPYAPGRSLYLRLCIFFLMLLFFSLDGLA